MQVEALKEQLWELDTANRNNLVFYGVREEGLSPEAAIRDVIKRYQTALSSTVLYLSPITFMVKSIFSTSSKEFL